MVSHFRIAATLVLGVALMSPATAVQAHPLFPAKHRYGSFLYDFRGACDDLVFEEAEYLAGESCYVFIRTYPAKPRRTMRLEYWDDDSLGWAVESSKRTDKRGRVTIEIDPLCSDGNFCSGTWEYQIHSPKKGRWVAMWSYDTIDIEFVPTPPV